MIPIKDSPEVIHDSPAILRIDMTDMDRESIQTMLENSRDGFYSNKELAPIREYSTNARDAHVQAGIPKRRIEVTLPTQLAPELKIRDFGQGITFDDIANVYFKYWKSTKRFTNDQNGCLGIGAKSAFAYTAVYTVTTWCEGMKTVSTGQKNGWADVIARVPKDPSEPDGVEVTIPIEQKDIDKFVHEALDFFKYWEPECRPIFHNVEEEKLKEYFTLVDSTPFLSGDGWCVRPAGYGKGVSRVVMGFVPYPIDWEQVENSLDQEVKVKVKGIFDFLSENITTLQFPIGSPAFTPNREALQYNESTVKALSEKLIQIYNTLLHLISDKISGAANLWEAKITYNRLFRKEMEGFDKTLTYGGNLNTIENLLSDRIEWMGIKIENGYFDNLEEWDKLEGNKNADAYHRKASDNLFFWVEKDDSGHSATGVKFNRVKRWGSGKMYCSPRNIVIIQDTDKPILAKAFARWFLTASGQDLHAVYVLDLHVKAVRDAFFKAYHFDTVPVHYVSQNIQKIKEYRKTLRTANMANNGNTVDRRPLYCPFIEIKSRKITYGMDNPCWQYEEVNARGIEGGVYLPFTKDGPVLRGGKTLENHYSGNFWQSVWMVCQKFGIDLTKVYAIHQKTIDANWFKEAVEEGRWTHFEDYIKEELENALPKDQTKKACAYNEIDINLRIGTVLAEKLIPQMVDDTSPLFKFCQSVVTDVEPNLGYCGLITQLQLKDWSATDAETKVIKDSLKELKRRYPLIYRHKNDDAIQSCDPKNQCYKLSKEEITEIVDYVNMVDLYLTTQPKICKNV